MKRKYIRIFIIIFLIIVLLGTSVVTFLPAAHANLPSLEKIRVALFIDTGKYYRNVIPTVTLSSPKGLMIQAKTASATLPYVSLSEGLKVRLGMDQFTLKVIETTDTAKAKQTANTLQSNSLANSIWVHVRNGQKLYQVVSGSYSTLDKASAAAFKVTSVTGLNPLVIGSDRWVAGQFDTLEAAKNQADRIENLGFVAYIAMVHTDTGVLAYQVRVGDEAGAEALQSLRDQMTAVLLDVPLTAVDPNQAYLLIKNTELSTGESIAQYYFKKTGQRVHVIPNPTGSNTPSLVQVSERENREYRGFIELTNYGGNMAVINELDMEEYLYSVVSSEMASGWPMEALKAQAVASRTYAVGLGLKYVIAHLSDTTFDQAYKAYKIEKPDVREAVDATSGQVLMFNDRLATAFYYSNAGGITSHPSEVWGGDVPNLVPVQSPDDGLLKTTPLWYRLMLKDGTIGYIRSDLVRVLSNKHETGRAYVEVLVPNVNFRTGPSTQDHATIRTLSVGEEAVLLEEVYQNSSYSWITGPISAESIMKTINSKTTTGLTSPVFSLEVLKRGPSGRAMEVFANGHPIVVSSPDSIRTALGSLRSTNFKVEQMGSYRVLGAAGRYVDLPQSNPNGLHAISSGGKVTMGLNGSHDTFFIQGIQDRTRIATESAQYRFIGKGFGHGLGMSQYGAKGLAESGYGYADILRHYYSNNIFITPVNK
jgi:stage II sporulation protein D